MFGSFLHTHLVGELKKVFLLYSTLIAVLKLGSGVELTVLKRRDSCGNTSRYEQVNIIERNLNYDFNYQQFVHLPREITVMPVSKYI